MKSPEEETYCLKHHKSKCDACEAVKESINHWEVDIIQPLKEGRVIKNKSLSWTDTQEQVPCTSKYCPLCDIYLDKEVSDEEDSEEFCKRCPYFKHYGYACDNFLGHWTAFAINPDLEHAEEMKLALIELLS